MTSQTTSLNTALTGLNAATTQTEIIANNIANALTPGYAAQSVELSSAIVEGEGAGVAVVGLTLAADPVTTANRRASDTALGYTSVMQEAQTALANAIGTPDVDGSLADYAVAFETALVAASNDPAATANLTNLANAAGDYANAINTAADDVRAVRQQADSDIARMVDDINGILSEVERLNGEIQAAEATGGETAPLVNQRDLQVDALSEYMPIQIFPRDNNGIALYTTGGGLLLDGEAVELGFDPTPVITPDMTLTGGGLSPLTIDGDPVVIGDGSGVGQYDGGALSASFEVRDVTTPAVNTTLDALAEDLILRFEDPAVDPTLNPGDAGLFTDGGNALNPADTVGLAADLSLNAAVDPAQGGAVWRLRDGINAAAPGDVGNPTILNNLVVAAQAPVTPPAQTGVVTAVSMTGFAIEFSSEVATDQLSADAALSYESNLNLPLRQSESSVVGVNTDAELQNLILVEQAYAANARVISVIDELFDILLRI